MVNNAGKQVEYDQILHNAFQNGYILVYMSVYVVSLHQNTVLHVQKLHLLFFFSNSIFIPHL